MEDATDPGYQIMNEEEIVADLMHDREELESEDEDEAHSRSAVTPSQACAAFDTGWSLKAAQTLHILCWSRVGEMTQLNSAGDL